MEAYVERLLASPTLPEELSRLNAALKDERARRARFYDEITPEMKAEVINGQFIVHGPSTNEHTGIRQRIEIQMGTFVCAHELGVVLSEKALCVFPRNDYEPDIVFFGTTKAAKLRRATLKFPVPDFICEVL